MKFVFVFSAVCLLVFTSALPSEYGVDKIEEALKEVKFELLPKELVAKLAEKFERDEELGADEISLAINEYADQIFDNLRNYINNHGLNDVEIPDASLKISGGHVDLSEGHLYDLNTIGRREDVVVTYNPDSKTLVLNLPIKFDDIKFTYHYKAKVLIVSIHGGIEGSVEGVAVNADLSFNFNSYQASLDHYDMKDSGKVSVKFTGGSIASHIANAILSVVDTLMGQVIVNVIAKFVRDNLRTLVDEVNQAIAAIINSY